MGKRNSSWIPYLSGLYITPHLLTNIFITFTLRIYFKILFSVLNLLGHPVFFQLCHVFKREFLSPFFTQSFHILKCFEVLTSGVPLGPPLHPYHLLPHRHPCNVTSKITVGRLSLGLIDRSQDVNASVGLFLPMSLLLLCA